MNENIPSRRLVTRCANGSARVRLLLFALLAMTTSFLSPLSAQTTIAIANSGFEDPTPSTFLDYTIGATSWTLTNTSIPAINAGNFAPGLTATPPPHPTPSPIAGSQVGYADGFQGLQQVLTDTFAANQLYTFSVYIGYRSDAVNNPPQGLGRIALGYLVSGTFTSLSSQSATVNSGNFNFVTGSYQTSAAELGQQIVLQLTSGASFQVLFDQVTLTVTAVPEPVAFACALGAAALGIAWWRRRVRPRCSSAPAGA